MCPLIPFLSEQVQFDGYAQSPLPVWMGEFLNSVYVCEVCMSEGNNSGAVRLTSVPAVLVENAKWRNTFPPKDGKVQLGFINAETGQVIRLNMQVEEAQQVMGTLMGYLDAIPSDLQEYLNRRGLRLVNY